MKNDAFGVGTDVENINRFREINLTKENNFLNKIFTKTEMDYCFSKNKTASHLAARFVGKEAIIKAICSLQETYPSHQEIEIVNDKKGVPRVNLNNFKFKNLKINISLSHSKEIALAFAIAMKV